MSCTPDLRVSPATVRIDGEVTAGDAAFDRCVFGECRGAAVINKARLTRSIIISLIVMMVRCLAYVIAPHGNHSLG